MSSPWNRIRPWVTVYAGLARRVLASVDLPEPLGPIRAWTSPLPTSRVSPRRMGLPSASTERSSIWSAGLFETEGVFTVSMVIPLPA